MKKVSVYSLLTILVLFRITLVLYIASLLAIPALLLYTAECYWAFASVVLAFVSVSAVLLIPLKNKVKEEYHLLMGTSI